ncbi:MAG: Bifunctional oligoribonuclease and PAP phosphatase NrnA [Formosa sp. Hel1_33_131]|nr:MAG: Bifunctional oligoribonuclease and PAP phosphatase NrnA [Formosa sp. Hel1_33_131]|tara:strand:+ start:2459 stop:3475 length:1017 start_codon:yes stop_codon:yes gene_type:complete
MNTAEILDLKKILSTPKKVVIVPHKNPDGDAMGSTLGLYHYLEKLGHSATVIAPNDYPEFLKWIPGTESVVIHEKELAVADALISDADLIFTLDFNALHRCGAMGIPIENSKAIKVMIDHHQQPDAYAAFMYSDVTMCSTCQMVYHFIEKMGDLDLIDTAIGEALYTGIMTDTASFRFPLTTSTTHRVIAHLIDVGVEKSKIHNAVYDTNSFGRLQLLGCALNNLRFLEVFKTAYISLSNKELDAHGFEKGDTEGLVNYGLSLKGAKFAVIFIEHKEESIIKISFRSKGDFDVNAFARTHFHGGGHKNASGGRSNLNLEDTIANFISILEDYKLELNS